MASGVHWVQGDGSYRHSWHQTRWGAHFTYILFCKSSPRGELILADWPLFTVPDSAHTDDPEELNRVLSSKVEELSEADREYFYSLADCKVLYSCCDDMCKSIQERRQAWKIKIYLGVGLAVSCYKHSSANYIVTEKSSYTFKEKDILHSLVDKIFTISY